MSLSQIIKIIGKYISRCNSFALSRIEFIFGKEVPWDNRHQPHTSLLWKLSYHGNQSETSITPLSLSCIEFIVSMEVLWDNRRQHIPRYYGNSVTMVTRVKSQ